MLASEDLIIKVKTLFICFNLPNPREQEGKPSMLHEVDEGGVSSYILRTRIPLSI